MQVVILLQSIKDESPIDRLQKNSLDFIQKPKCIIFNNFSSEIVQNLSPREKKKVLH